MIKNYFNLTKPTIMLLVILTGATALIVQGEFTTNPINALLILLGLYFTGGGANALNQCFERDVDARMERTRKRRPLPMGKISVAGAFAFSIGISILGVAIFWYFFNFMSAMISLGTVLFYSLFYTLWLKPNTPQNIVVGGIAGAMAPVIAWSAAAGELTMTPWLLFLIVFFWTPPHFWALALYYKDDYKEVGYPMMPLAVGDDSTLRQMLAYTVVLLLTTGALYFYEPGILYFAVSTVFGSMFIYKTYVVMQTKSRKSYINLFKFSIYHLFATFLGIIVDAFVL